MDTALIDHGSDVTRSVSEIPLVGSISRDPSSLSSPTSSPHHEPAAGINPSGGGDCGNGNGAPATEGPVGTNRISASPLRPRSHTHVPPAAAPISSEDVSKLDLAIMACTTGLVVPVALNMKDLTSSWDAPWKELYGVLMIASLTYTVTGFFTAWCPAVSWGRRISPSCARFGLADASALFIIFLVCKLGHRGCVAGVAYAALVVLVLIVVWAWSEREPATTSGVEATTTQQGAELPHDAP